MGVREAFRRIGDRVRDAMSGSVMPWYQGLAVREQRLVAVAALMFLVLFTVFGVIMPLHDKEAAMRQEVVQLAEQAREAGHLASSLQQGGGVGQHVDLLPAVEQLAVQTKVRSHMTRIRPQTGEGGRQLSLQLRNVPYDDVVRFVEALYRRHIGLERLRMQAADQPGYVHVEAVASGS